MSSRTSPSVRPIAIIGMSCRLPGGANSSDELWEFLHQCGQAWTPVPPDRFNEKAFYHPSPDNGNGTNHHQGGHFITGDLRDFDHSFFRLSSQQAAAMDPQQRLLLEVTYEALENAGLALRKLSGSNTSVHVATFTADFERNLYKDPLDMPAYYMTGTERAIASNRVSHAFDLRGPSITLDTACSGGLVSLHQACLGLLDGESDTAIVAAANVILSPDHYIGMSSLHLISGTGCSYPFDHRGDGYGRGEGCVVLVVKRLEDALVCRDPIHAVVRGTAVNQNGYNARGIVHPNSEAQISLTRATYERAGLNPYDVGYVEAHGTGTIQGDLEEVRAIAEVFTGPSRSLPLYVGSIKGNIAHTENTSGLAGILKAALVLDRLVIPPVAGFEKPKPGLPLDNICITTEAVPFPQKKDIIPRVSVNSFGFGGTNAHAILERSPATHFTSIERPSERSPKLFILSANSQASLAGMAQAYHRYLEEHQKTDLWSLSYTLCNRRTALPWRFSCVAHDRESLQAKLISSLLPIQRQIPRTNSSLKIFVFTGQGAQWVGMGRELLSGNMSSPIFRDSIRTSRDILFELGATWDLEHELLCEDESAHTRFATATFAQPATTALQIAITTLLRAQNIQPEVVVGHSSGEIAAAFAAGYLSQRTALGIAFHRGSMPALCKGRGLPQGAMMAVALSQREATPFLENATQGTVVIACINSPKSITVSGDASAIEELASRLDAKGGITYRRLSIDTAYHSNHMHAVASDYSVCIENLDFTPDKGDKVPFISSVTGQIKSSGFDFDYWVANLVSPVVFCNAIKTIGRRYLSDSSNVHAVVVEIGPHSALAGAVRQSLEDMQSAVPKFNYTSVLRRKVDAITSTLEFIGHLFEWRVGLDFDTIFEPATGLALGFDKASVLSNLPAYTWDHSVKHWHESRISSEYRHRKEPYHDLLGVRIVDSSSIEPRWRYMVDMVTLPWLADHIVDELVVFPGSGYLCMVLEAMFQLSREWRPRLSFETIVLREVAFLRALVLSDSLRRTEMQLSFKPRSNETAAFEFSITAFSDSKWYEYCRGTVQGVLSDQFEALPVEDALDPAIVETSQSPDSIILDKGKLYEQLAATGNKYGPTFMGCTCLKLTPGTSRVAAEVEIPDIKSVMPSQHQRDHLIHPATLDILLHTGLPIVKWCLGAGSVMPVTIDELLISTTGSLPQEPGTVLQVEAALESSHFRTANVSYCVSSNRVPVLSVAGLRMRSMASVSNESNNTAQTQNICYTLDWKMDVEFMRLDDFSPRPTLLELISHVCFKHADISVAELGINDEHLTSTILGMVDSQNGTLTSYICAIPMPSSPSNDSTRSQLADPRVRHVTLSSDAKFPDQDIQKHSCAVVLVATVANLKHAAAAAKKDGVILLLLEKDEYRLEELHQLVGNEVENNLEVQFAFPDSIRNKFIAVLRHVDVLQVAGIPKALRVLTHSPLHLNPPWVNALLKRLRTLGCSVALDQMNTGIMNDVDPSVCVVVIDDCPEPILSDPTCFDYVTKLLRHPARILWICPDSPIQMYQITGFSRTAHAENSELQLITIHSAINYLENEINIHRLVKILTTRFLTTRFSRFAADDNVTQPEREYRIRPDGAVLVPRLHRNEQLNRIVTGNNNGYPEVEMCRFTDNLRPLILSSGGMHKARVDSVFMDDPNTSDTIPNDDEIEIHTRAIRVPSNYHTASFGVYAGVVGQVGPAVRTFVSNDRVVAIGAFIGASHPRIRQAYVTHVPSSMTLTDAAGFLLNILAACYALHELAGLKPSARVLVCGALTVAGRAVVAVARSIGAHVTVQAEDYAESQRLMHQLHLKVEQVLMVRPYLGSPSSRDRLLDGVDVIVQTADRSVPSEMMTQLKAFGHVIFMQSPSQLSKMPVTLRNATIHLCDIAEILQLNPDSIATLMTRAILVLKNISTRGIQFCIRDVSQVAKALRLLDTGVHTAIILSAEEDSIAPTLMPHRTVPDLWESCNGSFIIAGGLGDLGQRLMLLMAQRGAKHLITLSRRVIRNDDHQALQVKLENIRPGCRLYCLKCDITSESDVREAAAALIRLGIPPVRGVIQSTVILQDRTLESMTFDDFLVPTRIKIDGTLMLQRVFASPDLMFFLMLSSASTIVGTSGQGNYNAGNAVQDAMSHMYSNSPCQFMTLSIGWIEDAVATVDYKVRAQGLSRAGLRSIQTAELLRYLDHALGAAMHRECIPQTIIGFDNNSLSQASNASGNSNMYSALFRYVYNTKRLASSPPTSEILSFDQLAANGDHSSLVEFIAHSIATRLIQILSTDAMRIHSENGSILDLGLDSLVAIELRNWIMQKFDAPLQSSEIILDQTIRKLAEKVSERSRKSPVGLNGQTRSSTAQEPSLASLSNQHSSDHQVILPRLPLPNLTDTLQLFQESRRAIDSEADQRSLGEAISAFLQMHGTKVQRQLEHLEPDAIADNYDRQVHLERRGPAQDGSFVFIHPIEAPPHSQAMRAAIVTVAAMHFARDLVSGKLDAGTARFMKMKNNSCDWLFYATRRPEIKVDRNVRFPPNQTVVVLSRGHVFQLGLGDSGQPLSLSAMHASYLAILELSSQTKDRVCILTADERNSWAMLRRSLESDPGNADTLSSLDKCAFIVCLDEEAPGTAGERYTQFLHNGRDRPFANRWMDKSVQFAVTMNGLSSGIYEHSKFDGLDARLLHRHVVKALMSSNRSPTLSEHTVNHTFTDPAPKSYPMRELFWSYGHDAKERIQHLEAEFHSSPSYGPIDHQHVRVEGLGRAFLRGRGISPNATANIIVIVALFLVDGRLRAAWETVSLAGFARGRRDYIQTVTPAMREFVEAITTTIKGYDDLNAVDRSTRVQARSLFREAARMHVKMVAMASQGGGFVHHLYAVRGLLTRTGYEQTNLPALFQTSAWHATKWRGTGQGIKISFEPSEEDESMDSAERGLYRWREAGFRVQGKDGVLVHCDVSENHTSISVSARPGYADLVCPAIQRAANVIKYLLAMD
ncbi:polyketide synthase [Xylaria castorea]|nr:polyketide synthase [Xylaria castorea]